MVFTEIAKLWNRGCEKEGRAKDDDRRAHLETVKKCRAELYSVRIPTLSILLLLC